MSEFKQLSDEQLEKVTGGFNWQAYGNCLINNGASNNPQLANLVTAILANDWTSVASITSKIAPSNYPLVSKCLNEQK